MGGSNGHDYVDLGLSVYWATCNIGADSPEKVGKYFAWGETEGYDVSDIGAGKKKVFNYQNYKFYNPSNSTPLKYTSIDGFATLEPEDDAAHVNWGGDWRMPEREEVLELFSAYQNYSELLGNGNPRTVTIKSQINNESIILPFGGYYNGSTRIGYNTTANISSNTVHRDFTTGGKFATWYLYVWDEDPRYLGSYDAEWPYRYYGFPVRPVLPK